MLKRRYRKKRGTRRFKRRGIYKSKRRSAVKRYDGCIFRKIVVEQPLTLFAANLTEANCLIHWGGNSAGIANLTEITHITNDEFDYFSANCAKYKVSGIKVQVRIADLDVQGSYVYDAHICSNTDTNMVPAITIEQMRNNDDYRSLAIAGGKSFKFYKGVGKFWWKNGYKWVSSGNSYGTACTMVKLRCSGFVAGNIIGYVTTTYYMAFKNYVGQP